MALIAGTLMTVHGIGKTFGTRQVLGDVSFQIGSGEIPGTVYFDDYRVALAPQG